MGLGTKILNYFGFGVKAHDFSVSPPFYDAALVPQSLYGMGRNVSGLESNVVAAPVMWIMRTFIEAQAIVESRRQPPEKNQKPVWEHSLDHAAELLLDQPNPFYDGDTLWQAVLASYVPNGNAFVRKVRNPFGDVIELWYLPHWLVTPKYPSDGSRYLDYYDFRSGIGVPERIAPRDMIHFRFGLDPQNTRLGLSPLASLLREVFTDDEAAIFSAAILKNMGVPGLIISPKDKSLRPSSADVDEVKRSFNDVTGTGRGGTKVLGVPTDVAQFGFDPNKLMLGNLRDISEERVCACLGLPAAVVGFGSGMQATKVGATMRELVKMAWVGCLSPMQKTLGKQTSRQLLPDFVSQTRRFRVRFDTADVSGFQEDDNQLATRVGGLVREGILRVDRAQAMLGLEVDESQKIYLRPSNSMPVDENGNPIRAAAPNGAVDGGEEEEIPPAVAARITGNGTDPEEEES